METVNVACTAAFVNAELEDAGIELRALVRHGELVYRNVRRETVRPIDVVIALGVALHGYDPTDGLARIADLLPAFRANDPDDQTTVEVWACEVIGRRLRAREWAIGAVRCLQPCECVPRVKVCDGSCWDPDGPLWSPAEAQLVARWHTDRLQSAGIPRRAYVVPGTSQVKFRETDG